MRPPISLRLAAYGFVDEHAGSLCSGHYMVLQELLRQGARIDLYAIEGWVKPGNLAEFENLSYFPIRREVCRTIYRAIDKLPGRRFRRGLTYAFANLVAKWLDWQPIGDAICRAHDRQPYDALLVMGHLSPWRIPGLLTISWTQGPPNGESEWFRKNIFSSGRDLGWCFLPLLFGGYFLKRIEARAMLPRSDLIGAGSSWAVSQWIRCKVPREKLVVLPYPVDLNKFRPNIIPKAAPAKEFLFLHLGRIASRKRVDLLLDAFELVAEVKPDARLLIIGRSLIPSMTRRLRNLGRNARVEYRESVPHADVPQLIAAADCVVQPSENENFGSAVAESLACGRPVVVGPTNGTKDFIGLDSVVFDAYTPQSVAQAMLEVMRRVDQSGEEYSAASRAAAEAMLSAPAIAQLIRQAISTSST